MTSAQIRVHNPSNRPGRIFSAFILGTLLVLATTRTAQAGKPGPGTTIIPNPLAEQAGAKLLVQQDGWYRVSRQSLIDAGWDPGSSADYLQLWAEGQQQAILVNAGSDSSFDPADTIAFYGTALDTPSTGVRVYWLVRGSSRGLRIAPASLPRGQAAAAPVSFVDTSVFAPKTTFWPGVATGSPDGFYGDVVTSTPVSEPISATDLAASVPTTLTLEVTLRGRSPSAHLVAVALNGNSAGTMSFYGGDGLTTAFSVPGAWVLSGANAVTLAALNGPGDLSMVESIKLTYPRNYSAVDGVLRMTAPSASSVKVGRFTSPSVLAFDVSSPAAPKQLAVTVAPAGSTFAASFTTPSSKTALKVLAVAADRVLAPEIVANAPSALASTTNQADLVVISPQAMMLAAEPLVTLRQQQGLLVATIDVTDVYDTFGYGAKSPQAIRTFLQYAQLKWSKAPRYVLLLGGASLDPRNHLGFGDLDFVPTRLVATGYGLVASDDWLVDFDDDTLPNMAIGRIPTRSSQETETVISKIVSYGQQTGSWTRNILLAADKNDTGLDFESASASVAALVPSGFTTQRVLSGQVGATAAAAAILDGTNEGQLIVNYQGHGYQTAWAYPGIFTVGSVQSLTNTGHLSFFVSMSCLTGYFADPATVSLAAALLTAPNGGAVAYLGFSGLSGLGGETEINRQLYSLLFAGTRPALGDAVAQAKAATVDYDTRKTLIFFGDPSMKLAQ